MLKLADGVVDIQSLFMPLAVQVVTAIMDAEVDQLCGDGANNRNGNRGRLVTCVGMLNLGVPQLWTGGFFPEDVLEHHRRVDRALVAAVAEMCATGTSCVSSRGFEQKEHRKLSSRSIGSAHAF